ncbi:MAG TPA: hypothetical protein VI756_17805, partial [Blastocatellia bacterium]
IIEIGDNGIFLGALVYRVSDPLQLLVIVLETRLVDPVKMFPCRLAPLYLTPMPAHRHLMNDLRRPFTVETQRFAEVAQRRDYGFKLAGFFNTLLAGEPFPRENACRFPGGR